MKACGNLIKRLRPRTSTHENISVDILLDLPDKVGVQILLRFDRASEGNQVRGFVAPHGRPQAVAILQTEVIKVRGAELMTKGAKEVNEKLEKVKFGQTISSEYPSQVLESSPSSLPSRLQLGIGNERSLRG